MFLSLDSPSPSLHIPLVLFKPQVRTTSQSSMPVKRKASNQQLGEAKHAKGDEIKAHLTELLKEVDQLQDPEVNAKWAEPFHRLVPKKQFPDYYEIIDNPISLAEIGRKVKSGAYPTKDAFVADFELMLSNAELYNEPSLWIITAAKALLDHVKNTLHAKIRLKLANKKPEDEDITFGNLPKVCIKLTEEVRDHKFEPEGVLSGPFLEDVDTDVYPDYTQYVATPTLFASVMLKLELKKFFSPKHSLMDNLQRYAKEVRSIFSNAQLYNDPESMIYQDAEKILQYFNKRFDAVKEKLEKQLQARQKARLHREEPPAVVLAPPPPPPPPKPVVDIVADKLLANNMGKTAGNLPKGLTIIQAFAFGLAVTVAATTASNKPQFGPQNLGRHLFPTHKFGQTTLLFDYYFGPTGYSVQAYLITLPPGSKPAVQANVQLHQLLYGLRRRDLELGMGYHSLTSDEDFQCTLRVNEDDVASSDALVEGDRLLGVNYSFKLNHGLNVIEFEIKTAPHVAKKIKELAEEEEEDSSGRHTRHQFQQMKMLWDVERVTLYVNYNAF